MGMSCCVQRMCTASRKGFGALIPYKSLDPVVHSHPGNSHLGPPSLLGFRGFFEFSCSYPSSGGLNFHVWLRVLTPLGRGLS